MQALYGIKQANKMTFITHRFRVSVVSDVRERVWDFRITFALYVKIFISWVCKCVTRNRCLQSVKFFFYSSVCASMFVKKS